MRRLGSKKTPGKIAGHQNCGVCHPNTKAGRAQEIAAQRKVEVRAWVEPIGSAHCTSCREFMDPDDKWFWDAYADPICADCNAARQKRGHR